MIPESLKNMQVTHHRPDFCVDMGLSSLIAQVHQLEEFVGNCAKLGAIAFNFEVNQPPEGGFRLVADAYRDGQALRMMEESIQKISEHNVQLEEEVHAERERVQLLLDHCPDLECSTCATIVCPHGEPLHFHHDGCPACAQAEDQP